MRKQIIQRHLSGDGSCDYFVQALEFAGAPVGELQSQLKRGAFTAVVPVGTSDERIRQLDLGGLLPAEPKRQVGDKWIKATPTTVPSLAKIVARRLQLLDAPVLWVHEAMLSEAELEPLIADKLRAGDVRCTRVDGQLYLGYRGFLDEAGVRDAIDMSMLSWHFLAFVADHAPEPGSLSELFARSSMILVGAYDGESALIWEREA
jgi:hypothetical protein